MGSNSAQEMGNLEWPIHSILPFRAKWNENLFHFAPEGFFGMQHFVARYTGK